MNNLPQILTIGSAVGSGLMAGLFFTFSNFVMKALADAPAGYGASAMREINLKIINPWFLAIFMGTAIFSLILIAFAVMNWQEPGSPWLLGGGLLYIVGCILVTIICNVPLNDALAASQDGSISWEDYLTRWMPWNHLRTIATVASTTAFIIALTSRT